jgi:hypothetical protein
MEENKIEPYKKDNIGYDKDKQQTNNDIPDENKESPTNPRKSPLRKSPRASPSYQRHSHDNYQPTSILK